MADRLYQAAPISDPSPVIPVEPIPPAVPPMAVITSQAKPAIDHSGFFNDILNGKRKIPVLLIGFILGVLSAVKPVYTLFKEGLPYVKTLDSRITAVINETIPDKLEITLKGGKATSNLEEPYFITVSSSVLDGLLPTESKEVSDPETQPQSKIRLLTINTGGQVEDFDKFQSAAMLTGGSFVYYSDGEVTVKSLSQVPDMVISKKMILGKIDEIKTKLHLLTVSTWFIYLSPLIISLGYLLYFLLEVLSAAFLSWIMNKILGTSLKFNKIFGLVGIIYAVPAFILSAVARISFLNPFYSWIYTLSDVITLSLVYVILHNYKDGLVKESV